MEWVVRNRPPRKKAPEIGCWEEQRRGAVTPLRAAGICFAGYPPAWMWADARTGWRNRGGHAASGQNGPLARSFKEKSTRKPHAQQGGAHGLKTGRPAVKAARQPAKTMRMRTHAPARKNARPAKQAAQRATQAAGPRRKQQGRKAGRWPTPQELVLPPLKALWLRACTVHRPAHLLDRSCGRFSIQYFF